MSSAQRELETLELFLTVCCNRCGSVADFRELVEKAIVASEHSLQISSNEYGDLCAQMKVFARGLDGLSADHPKAMQYYKIRVILERGANKISRKEANEIRDACKKWGIK